MFGKKALVLLTAAVMLIGSAAALPAAAVSAADKDSQTAEKYETSDLELDVPVKGSEVSFTAEQLSNAKVKYFTVKFSPEKTHWAAVFVMRVPSGTHSEAEWDKYWAKSYEIGAWEPDGTKSYTQIIPLKDIIAKVGKLEDGDELVFMTGENIKSSTVTPHSRRPDIELETGSIPSGIIKEQEDWTPDGGVPNGKVDLIIGDITLISSTEEMPFKGYKSLKIDCTIEDTSQLESVMVILHGWEDNSVGWETLSYKAKASGTITVDLKPYQNKTYHNIYVRAVVPKTAQIGEEYTPGLTVTSAKLISSDPPASSGKSTAGISNLKAKSTETAVSLTWDSVSGADKYRVFMYNDKTGKYEKYKDVKSAKCTVSGLKAGTKYKFRVTAYSKGKDGKYVKGKSSDAVSVTTKK